MRFQLVKNRVTNSKWLIPNDRNLDLKQEIEPCAADVGAQLDILVVADAPLPITPSR